MKIILSKIFLFLLLLTVNTLVSADTTSVIQLKPIEIDGNIKSIELNPYIRVWHSMVKFEASDVVNAIKNNQLTEYTQIKPPGFSKDYFWLIFDIKNQCSESIKLFIELDNPHVDTCYIYKLNNCYEAELIGQSGDMMPFYDRTYNNTTPVFPVQIKGQETIRYIIFFNKRFASVDYPLKIWNRELFERQTSKSSLINFIYFGILIIWIAMALFIGLLNKNKLLLSYTVYLLTIFLLIVVSTGYAFQFIFPNTPIINEVVRFPFSVLMPISLIEFSNEFLGTKKFAPFLMKYFYSIYAISIFILIIWAVFNRQQQELFPGVLVRTQYIVILISLITIFLSIFLIYKKNRRNVIIYLTAISAITIGSIAHMLREFGILSATIIYINPILLGSFFELLIFMVAIILSVQDTYKRENKLLQLLATSQKDNLKHHIEGAEEQAYKISTELHDNIGSQLAHLKRQINDLDKNSSQNMLLKTITGVYEDIRKLSQRLSPTIIKITDFKTASKQFLKDYFAQTNIKVNFYISENAKIEKKIALPLYRIIQEASVNCLKHAKATEFSVQIFEYDDEIVASIEDNGVGFQTDTYNIQNGIGIVNMKSRAETFNGEFDISSFPHKGTSIIVKIPK